MAYACNLLLKRAFKSLTQSSVASKIEFDCNWNLLFVIMVLLVLIVWMCKFIKIIFDKVQNSMKNYYRNGKDGWNNREDDFIFLQFLKTPLAYNS